MFKSKNETCSKIDIIAKELGLSIAYVHVREWKKRLKRKKEKNKMRKINKIFMTAILLLVLLVSQASATVTVDETYKIPVKTTGVTTGVSIGDYLINETDYLIEFGQNYNIDVENVTDTHVRTARLTDTRFITIWHSINDNISGVVGNVDPNTKEIVFGDVVTLMDYGNYPFIDITAYNESWAIFNFEWNIVPEYHLKFAILYVTDDDTLNMGTHWLWKASGGLLHYRFAEDCIAVTNTTNKDNVHLFQFVFKLAIFSSVNFNMRTQVMFFDDNKDFTKVVSATPTIENSYVTIPSRLICLDESFSGWNLAVFYVTNEVGYMKTFYQDSDGSNPTQYTRVHVADNIEQNETEWGMFNDTKCLLYYQNKSTNQLNYRVGTLDTKVFELEDEYSLPSTGQNNISLTILQEDKAILGYGINGSNAQCHYVWRNPDDLLFTTNAQSINTTNAYDLQFIKMTDTSFISGCSKGTDPFYPYIRFANITKYLYVDFFSNTSGTWQKYANMKVYENGTIYATNSNMTVADTMYYWNASVWNPAFDYDTDVSFFLGIAGDSGSSGQFIIVSNQMVMPMVLGCMVFLPFVALKRKKDKKNS